MGKLKDHLHPFLTAYNAFKMIPLQQDWAQVLEAKYSIFALEKILTQLRTQRNKSITPLLIKPLQDFLDARWEHIRGTDLAYPYAPNNRLNALCVMLAQAIAPITGKSTNQLLMPTIAQTKNPIGSDLDELEIHEFILSDDDTQFIEILSTLEQATNDGELKRFDEKDQKFKPLSTSEQERLINHSPESKAYYNELKKVADLKNKGKSVGAYLTRLVTELNSGGKHGGKDGTEDKAGTDAYAGIINFRDILQTLTPTEREFVYGCTAPGLTVAKNFKAIWFRLLSRAALDGKIKLPETEVAAMVAYLTLDEHVTNQVPCAELSASNIEQILEANKSLFDMYPQAPAKESIISLENKREKAKQQFIASNVNPNSTESNPVVDAPVLFHQNSSHAILKRLLSKPAIETPISISNIQLADGYQLKKIILSQPLALSESEYAKLLHFFGAKQLGEIIRDKFEFADLIANLSTAQSHLLITLLGPSFFQKIIPTSYEFGMILKKFTSLPAEKWQHLGPLFKMDCMQNVVSEFLLNEFNDMQPNSREMWVNTLGVNHIALLLQRIPPEKFSTTLALFSPEHQKAIRAASFQSLLENISSLCQNRKSKSSYLGIFKARAEKTRAAYVLKDVMEKKADKESLSPFEKQLNKENELGQIHRRWMSLQA